MKKGLKSKGKGKVKKGKLSKKKLSGASLLLNKNIGTIQNKIFFENLEKNKIIETLKPNSTIHILNCKNCEIEFNFKNVTKGKALMISNSSNLKIKFNENFGILTQKVEFYKCKNVDIIFKGEKNSINTLSLDSLEDCSVELSNQIWDKCQIILVNNKNLTLKQHFKTNNQIKSHLVKLPEKEEEKEEDKKADKEEESSKLQYKGCLKNGKLTIAPIIRLGCKLYTKEEKDLSDEKDAKIKDGLHSFVSKIFKKKRNLQSEHSKKTSLQDFGYTFNYGDKNYLVKCDKKTGEVLKPIQYFTFEGQDHYDWLGDQIVIETQKRILEKYKNHIQEICLNENEKNKEKRVNIWTTKNYLFDKNENKKKVLVVLIQGTGVVRIGQWAMSVIVNGPDPKFGEGGMKAGSIIPYIEHCIKNNYEMVILNPNKTHTIDEKGIKGLDTKIKHTLHVFDNYIKKSLQKVDDLVIIAHSWGGICTINGLLEQREKDILPKLSSVAFTDSAHKPSMLKSVSEEIKTFLRKNSRNWVESNDDLGIYHSFHAGVECFSSGCDEHKWTSHFAKEEVFKYIKNKLK